MSKLKDWLLHAFFPRRCPFCDDVIAWKDECCDTCEKQIELLDVESCIACGKEQCCCRTKGHAVLYVLSLFDYDGMYKHGIFALKYHGDYESARFFGRLLAEQVKRWRPRIHFDLVIPVPMTEAKKKKRAYNQAEILATAVADHLMIRSDAEVLVKPYETKEQHTLTRHVRERNLRHTYRVENPHRIKGKLVLLVDDVYTTGSTTAECAKQLMRHGARGVVVGTVCKTSLKQTEHQAKEESQVSF